MRHSARSGRDPKGALLEGMQWNAKTLKRNNRESNGILIGTSMAPPFFRGRKDSPVIGFSPTTLARKSASGPNPAARMAGRRPEGFAGNKN